MKKFRFRNVYIVLFSLLVLTLWTLSDPDRGLIQQLPIGAGTMIIILNCLKAVIYISLFHVSRKALMDYIDFETLFNRARTEPLAAAVFAIAVAIMGLAIAVVIHASVYG